MAKKEEEIMGVETILQELIDFIQTDDSFKESEKKLGTYRLYSLKKEYSVKDFVNIAFNPILGLKVDLIKSLSRHCNEPWLKRAHQLHKIYFSVKSIRSSFAFKKTVHLSTELIGEGNDKKPVIFINQY